MKMMRSGIDCRGNEWEEIELGHAKNITGVTSGKLTALFRVSRPNDQTKNTWWLCQCKCGNYVIIRSAYLLNGNSKSCGCSHLESSRKNSGYQDLIGMRFSSLTVLERTINPRKDKKAYFKCLCDCGQFTVAQGSELRSGHTRSCGCKRGLSAGERKIKTILEQNNIQYIYNKVVFKDLITVGGGYGRYDFVLIDKNNQPYRIIEYDGMQHYKPISFYNLIAPEKNLQYTQTNDEIKTEYALKHHIPLVRIPYTQLQHITYDMIMGDNFLVKE